jgi:hypothetical protein
MAGLVLETKLRPCFVRIDEDEKWKGLFHCWVHNNSNTIGKTVFALVEMADGQIIQCSPAMIQFVDNAYADYIWPDA